MVDRLRESKTTHLLDSLSESYDSVLEAHFPVLDPVETPSDWHLRLVWLPDGKPEVIYSINGRSSTAQITLVRFLESAWRRFAVAYQQEEERVSVPVEIGELDLPKVGTRSRAKTPILTIIEP